MPRAATGRTCCRPWPRTCAALDYTLDGVAQLLGPSASAALNRDQIIPALLATDAAASRDSGTGPLAAVVRLWLLAEPQERVALDAAPAGPGCGRPGGAGTR